MPIFKRSRVLPEGGARRNIWLLLQHVTRHMSLVTFFAFLLHTFPPSFLSGSTLHRGVRISSAGHCRRLVARSRGDETLARGARPGVIGESRGIPGKRQPRHRRSARPADALPPRASL